LLDKGAYQLQWNQDFVEYNQSNCLVLGEYSLVVLDTVASGDDLTAVFFVTTFGK
jgi:hypothetical protein